MNRIIGVSYPIPSSVVERFFVDKDVLIKPATSFKFLEPGMRLFLYRSQEDTGFVGEALIKSVKLSSDPSSLFQEYGERIFLKETEFKDYQSRSKKMWHKGNSHPMKMRKKGDRKSRSPRQTRWMAIELTDIKKYNSVRRIKGFIPVGGKYIRE